MVMFSLEQLTTELGSPPRGFQSPPGGFEKLRIQDDAIKTYYNSNNNNNNSNNNNNNNDDNNNNNKNKNKNKKKKNNNKTYWPSSEPISTSESLWKFHLTCHSLILSPRDKEQQPLTC